MGIQSPRAGLPFSAFAKRGVRGTVPLPQGSQRGSVVGSRPHPPPFAHALRSRELSTTAKRHQELVTRIPDNV